MSRSSALLSQGDPKPVRVLNPGAGARFLIVCDHAGRRIPARLNGLGLPAAELDRHIAYDLGAEAVAERLAAELGACALFQAYSRLVIDCNRGPDAEGAIATTADGTEIPGNAGLSDADRQARVREVFEPYHGAIAAELDHAHAAGAPPVLVSIHSFTPELGGAARPWAFGVIHGSDSAFSRAVLARLIAERVEPIGDNEPYAMDGTDYTVPFHAGSRGLDYLELEMRQDLIASPEDQEAVATMLARVLRAAAQAP